MTPSSDAAHDSTRDTTPASDGGRVQVLIRLTADEHRDMRRAMAELGVRTNQAFAATAITEKVARVFAPKAAIDGPTGRRQAAGRRKSDLAA